MDRRTFLGSTVAATALVAVGHPPVPVVITGYTADLPASALPVFVRNQWLTWAKIHWSNGKTTTYNGSLSVLEEAVQVAADNDRLIEICLDEKHRKCCPKLPNQSDNTPPRRSNTDGGASF